MLKSIDMYTCSRRDPRFLKRRVGEEDRHKVRRQELIGTRSDFCRMRDCRAENRKNEKRKLRNGFKIKMIK